MFHPNQERLSKIKELRARRLTIDRIAAVTGYPRSSVDYYVRRYCGGRTRIGTGATVRPLAQHESIRFMPMNIPRPERDRLEVYLKEIERKEGLSVQSILDGKEKEYDQDLLTILSNALEKDPEALYAKLNAIKELIRLAPLLRLDLDRMRTLIGLALDTEDSTRNII